MTSPILTRTKRPRTILAGPYGHPVHPMLVTLPIGAWVASLFFDLIALSTDEPAVFAKGAYWLIGIGIVGALVAATFGFLDLLAIPGGTPAFDGTVAHGAQSHRGRSVPHRLRRPRHRQLRGAKHPGPDPQPGRPGAARLLRLARRLACLPLRRPGSR